MANLLRAEVNGFGVAAAVYEGLHEIFKGQTEGWRPPHPKSSAKGNISTTKAFAPRWSLKSHPRKSPRSWGCSHPCAQGQARLSGTYECPDGQGLPSWGCSALLLPRWTFPASPSLQKDETPSLPMESFPASLREEGQRGQLGWATRSPLSTAAQALGMFYNLIKRKPRQHQR